MPHPPVPRIQQVRLVDMGYFLHNLTTHLYTSISGLEPQTIKSPDLSELLQRAHSYALPHVQTNVVSHLPLEAMPLPTCFASLTCTYSVDVLLIRNLIPFFYAESKELNR